MQESDDSSDYLKIYSQLTTDNKRLTLLDFIMPFIMCYMKLCRQSEAGGRLYGKNDRRSGTC
jgi:hypothetical protein